MRIVLSIIGAGGLLCSACLAHSPATSTTTAPAANTSLTATLPSKVILGGYVGQQVANSVVLGEDEDFINQLEKMEELRLYQHWKKKPMKF